MRTRKVRHTSRRHIIYSTFACIFASTSVLAQDSESLDCSKALAVEGVVYDLKLLANEHKLTRNRTTPPTTMRDELWFNVCEDLPHQDGVPEGDQCPTGTRACLTKINEKDGVEDRVVSTIPVAQSSTLKPSYSNLQSPEGLHIQLHGVSYPPDSSSVPHSLNLTLLCQENSGPDPTFMSYENGVVNVEWKSSAGCPVKSGDGGHDGDAPEDLGRSHSAGGSGIGWFFLLLFISFLGYFLLGAYYNYNNFGATGWDLIPHRDFWRDVPYLLRDFVEHLCTTLRPGRQGGSRRGYIAV